MDSGNNVVVGGYLGNFTAGAGSNTQFIIEDPSLLGVPAGTVLPTGTGSGGIFNGGGGEDSFYFVGGSAASPFGNVVLTEPSGSTGTTDLDFSNFTDGGVNLNLNLNNGQVQQVSQDLTLTSAGRNGILKRHRQPRFGRNHRR